MKKYQLLYLILFLFFTYLPLSAKDDLPEWLKNRHDSRFPEALYLQAVGQAEIGKNTDESMAQAEIMAKSQLAEQLRVNIQSKLIILKFEDQSGPGYQEQVSEEILASTEIALSGLRIENNFVDKKKKICYALAILDRRTAVAGMVKEILMLKNGANGAIENSQSLMNTHKPFQAIFSIRRAYSLLVAAGERELILPILKTRNMDLDDLPSILTTEQVLKSLQEVGENIGITIQNPIHQIQGQSGLPLQTGAVLYYANQPLANVTLTCSFIGGRGNARILSPSDANGHFEIIVSELQSAANGDYQIEVMPDILNLLLTSEPGHNTVWNEALKHAFRPGNVSLKKLDLDLEDYCAGAVMELVNRLSVSNPSFKLIAGNLTYAETGASSDFVAYLKDKISGELALIPGIQLIAPDKIDQSLRQAKETYRGSKRPDNPEILAELIDADGVFVGSYWDRQDLLEFNLKIVARNSAATLSTAFIKLPKFLIPGEMTFLPANFATFNQAREFGNIKQSKNNLSVDVWVDRGDGAIYRCGDKLTVFVRASQDCYLYLIYHDADGNDILIYPNARQANNRILSGIIYQIPDARDTFDFKVQPPFGTELLKAIVSSEPLPDLAGKILSNGLKLLVGSYQDNLVKLRGITHPNNYAEGSCVLTTIK
jgi:hypothetical protein